MKNFKSETQRLQNDYAFNCEYNSVDYSMVNEAEIVAEQKAREYASENNFEGHFEIWEDGVTNSELTEDQNALIEIVYIEAYEAELDRQSNG